MNSSKPTFTDLLKQRQDLAKAEQAFKHHHQLIQKREILENAMIKLQEEMELNFRHFHLARKTEKKINHFQHVMHKTQHHLQQLRQMQKELDHLIDQSEELSEESLEQQRDQLLLAIWHLYPSQREEQETQWQEWKHLHMIEMELEAIKQLLLHLSEHLQTAIQARQSIKGRGILNYIFGISPNMIIEQQLMRVHHLILKALPPLQQVILRSKENSSLRLLFEESYAFLDPLNTSCQLPWGFHHLDTTFLQAYQTLLQLLDRVNLQQEELSQQENRLKKEIQKWIQQLEENEKGLILDD